MTFVPLSLNHQSVIEAACHRLALPINEYSFATLYLYRHGDKSEFLEESQGHHWVRGVSREGSVFLMPLFHPADWQRSIAFAKEVGAEYLYPICEAWTGELSQFRVVFDEAEADYCFDRETIQNYAGRRFDGLRNWVKRLLAAHTMRVEPYRVELFDDADAIITAWAHGRSSGIADAAECREGARLADRLGLQGYLFYAENIPVGLLLGESLLENMFVIHFAKAVTGYPGIYQYMYQVCAQQLSPQYRWLNWEQDLGIDRLRKAKMVYHPTSFSRKAKVYPS